VNPATVAREIDRLLRATGTPERAAGEKAYLKSDLEFYGVTVPAMRKAVLAVWRDSGPLDHDEVVAVVEALWATGIHECRMAVVELLTLALPELGEGDVPLVERLLRESRTWALVDGLAATVVGGIDAMAGIGPTLERWGRDPDFWIRRSALLAHLQGLRSGDGEIGRFLRLAEGMLDEKEFFIRKAIGWCLRELGKRRPDAVVEWLAPRTDRASGVTMREAVKPLSDAEARRLMGAYRDRRAAG
jgi:3-methyladenine DNA glycosylase AlkD